MSRSHTSRGLSSGKSRPRSTAPMSTRTPARAKAAWGGVAAVRRVDRGHLRSEWRSDWLVTGVVSGVVSGVVTGVLTGVVARGALIFAHSSICIRSRADGADTGLTRTPPHVAGRAAAPAAPAAFPFAALALLGLAAFAPASLGACTCQ